MHYYRRSDFVNPTAENDFSTGSIPAHMLRLALPMTLAQLINVLYNIIDRIFIGRIPFDSTNALTGLGVAFPICTITIAFANLVGMGGAPLFSIERGKRNDAEAEKILGNSFVLFTVVRPVYYNNGAAFETSAFISARRKRSHLPLCRFIHYHLPVRFCFCNVKPWLKFIY